MELAAFVTAQNFQYRANISFFWHLAHTPGYVLSKHNNKAKRHCMINISKYQQLFNIKLTMFR